MLLGQVVLPFSAIAETITNHSLIEKLDSESDAMDALIAGRGNGGLGQPPGTMPGGKE
jgi:hypothetical protein